MRTIVDIPESDIAVLDDISTKENRSRASVIRDAIAAYLEEKSATTDPDAAFGLWAEHKIDGLSYQKKIRAEWNDE